MRIAVDCKNLALYSAGIASFFRPLLKAWLDHRPDLHFRLVGPAFDTSDFPDSGNWQTVAVPWPEGLPRPLRHPVYDNWLFPRALRQVKPDVVFSPYHDVRLPAKASGVRSGMMIHDTCLAELGAVYPWRVRAYFNAMLRTNLSRAERVLTVSEASRERIIGLYGLERGRVEVVYNTLDEAFRSPADEEAVAAVRARHPAALLLFYPGGCEYRKNAPRLVEAVARLAAGGHDPVLLVTGQEDGAWAGVLAGCDPAYRAHLAGRVRFVGRLDLKALKVHYAAADVVPYPSLCEGFGRLCLEAMSTGTALAVSDLPVLREVAGDYPVYFDPHDAAAIAQALRTARERGRQAPVIDPRFGFDAVARRFLAAMDEFVAGEKR